MIADFMKATVEAMVIQTDLVAIVMVATEAAIPGGMEEVEVEVMAAVEEIECRASAQTCRK